MPPLLGLLGTLFTDVGLGSLGGALGTFAAPSALATGLGTGIPLAATLGTTIAGAVNQPGAPPAPPLPTPPNAQAQQNLNARVGQQEPNVVGANSGLASPSYDSLIAQILAGTLGQPGSTAAGASATGQNFTPANSQATNAAVQGTPVNLSDFLSTST
jgi:hypothetical protein